LIAKGDTAMPTQELTHGSFIIERSYPNTPEEVFTAFADPAKKRRWFAEGPNKSVAEFASDFRVGGQESARYSYQEGTPFTGIPFAYDASYQNIVPNQRIVSAHTMTIGGNCISASLMMFEFVPTGRGTDLVCSFQGYFFEGSDGAQIREMGWRKLLVRLAEELAQN